MSTSVRDRKIEKRPASGIRQMGRRDDGSSGARGGSGSGQDRAHAPGVCALYAEV